MDTKPSLTTINIPSHKLVHGYTRRIQKTLPNAPYYNIFIDIIEKILLYFFQDKKCKWHIRNEIFELYDYYKPIRLIGSGAYAVVCEAIDKRTQKAVAIKKVKHIFDDIRDAKRIFKEIELLTYFTKYNHADLIRIYDTVVPQESQINVFENIYIIMPLMKFNLCKIITSKQKLCNLHYKYITYQILRGVKFIHECGLIHRDIKPENILLNSYCDVKIIDFGLAQGDKVPPTACCDYVCTKWYSAPESMLCNDDNNEKSDIWAVGCVMAEMILRRPLFPGANFLDQLQQIFDIMGTPTDTKWISNPQAKVWVNKLPKHSGKKFEDMFQKTFNDKIEMENCCDLLCQLLVLNPVNRISAADALKHVYFKDIYGPDEIQEGKIFRLSEECRKLMDTKADLIKLFYETMKKMHQNRWQKIIRKEKKKNVV